MNAFIALIGTIIIVALGYRFYASRVNATIIQADPKRATPATMYNDGVDFMPASGSVLFGYQFKSIAALGPIVGPILAAQWGWLPALLWLVIGVFFIGWVQDYASTMLAVRSEGMTMGGLSYKLISPRARSILLSFLYFYLLLIMAAFGGIVAGLMARAEVPIGFFILVIAGVLAGQMTYRWRQDLLLTTVVTVAIAIFGVWLGQTNFVKPIVGAINGIGGTTGADGTVAPLVMWNIGYGPYSWPLFLWGILMLLFCYLGSVLPIWRFAQPVNYTSFWLVLIGIVGSIAGIAIAALGGGANYTIEAYKGFSVPGPLAPGVLSPLWPLLFVVISCGAVSGWHSLVSTSGTARQLEKETDALPVGGGAMYTEAVLGVLSLSFAAAAFANYQGYIDEGIKKLGAPGIFANGMALFLNQLGIPRTFGAAFGSVFLVVMALTVMQLVLRFMRVASAELIGDRVPAFKSPHVGSLVAIVLTLLLLWTGFWNRIWILFGGSNQLFAGLALLLITIWLAQQQKPYNWAFIPGIFMYITTVAALLYTAWASLQLAFAPPLPGFAAFAWTFGNIVSGVIGLFLSIAALVLAYDGLQALNRARTAGLRPAAAAR
jgi:carbon starvation protein